jgi:hypothetical protein
VRRKWDVIVKGHRSVKFKGKERIRWLKMISLVVLIMLKYKSRLSYPSVKSRMKLGNDFYHSVPNLWYEYSSSHSIILKIKICLLFFMGVKLGHSH